MAWVRCRQQSGSLAWKYTTEVLEHWILCRKSVALLIFCPALTSFWSLPQLTCQSLFPAIKAVPARLPIVRRWAWSLCFPFLRFLIQISRALHVLPLSSIHASWARHASLKQTPLFQDLLLQNHNRWWLHVVSTQVALAFPLSGDNAKHDCEGAGYFTDISFLFCPLLIQIFKYLVPSGCFTRCHSWF